MPEQPQAARPNLLANCLLLVILAVALDVFFGASGTKRAIAFVDASLNSNPQAKPNSARANSISSRNPSVFQLPVARSDSNSVFVNPASQSDPTDRIQPATFSQIPGGMLNAQANQPIPSTSSIPDGEARNGHANTGSILTRQPTERVFDRETNRNDIASSDDKFSLSLNSLSPKARPQIPIRYFTVDSQFSNINEPPTQSARPIELNPEIDFYAPEESQLSSAREYDQSNTDVDSNLRQNRDQHPEPTVIPLDRPQWEPGDQPEPQIARPDIDAVTQPFESEKIEPETRGLTSLEPGAERSGAFPVDSTSESKSLNEISGREAALPNQTAAESTSEIAWPRPEYLFNQLDALTPRGPLAYWTTRTKSILEDLARIETLRAPEAVVIFQQLDRQIAELEPLIIQSSSQITDNVDEARGPAVVQLRRVAYSLRQQLDVWRAVHQLAIENYASISDSDPAKVVQFIAASRRSLTVPGLSSEWNEYLLVDQLGQAFNVINPDVKQQRSASRRFLTRLSSPVLDLQQRQFLSTALDRQFIEQLKAAARDELQLEKLLQEIESLQQDRSGVWQYRVNQHYQNLLWHGESTQDLADALDSHFRNANFRMSVSAELLNLLLPGQMESNEPVNEQILGAQVSGHSRVNNRLQIRLIPDTSRIHMRLEAIGLVRSQTEAYRSGVTIQNVGDARFQVFKRLFIERDGIVADRPHASSNSNNKMVGLKSNLDGIPLVGWVARRIAQRKIKEQTPEVENYAQRKLESRIKNRFDSEIEGQLASLQHYLYANLIEPLTALELEPTPLEMRSTDNRVIMRYRLAGRDQMAGNTARPRGLQSSLMSMQIHESTLNNLLNRIDLNGQKYTPESLAAHMSEVFGMQPASDSLGADAEFEFAPFDPIRIKFGDGSVAVQLNLKRLRVGDGKTWKNLTVTCNFIPQESAGKLVLVQDGNGIQLTGYRLGLRDQVAVRTIFTALFKNRYEIPILPKNIGQRIGPTLVISQLEVVDGWIGLSVDKAENINPLRMSELEPVRR